MNCTDVLKADRILVEDRIYRLLPIREKLKIHDDDKPLQTSHFDDDEDFDPELPIIHQGNRFFITIHVPESMIGYIVGANHKNIKNLEKQFGAKINIPSRKNVEAGITIHGSSRKIVALTYSNIQNRLINKRLKTDYTHFVSFPVNSTNIQESFLKFKEEILKKYGKVRGIDASIFQKPCKLHSTVVLLVLLDDREKENATAILTKCTDSFLREFGEKEMIAQIKGLEIMNDDMSEVDVLYAKLKEHDDDNRLQILADRIMNEFVNVNLSRKQYDNVKMHVTLMNTRFRDHAASEEDDFNRITFDVTPFFQEYEQYDFGQMIISEIHISIRYTEGSDGYYKCTHKIKLKS